MSEDMHAEDLASVKALASAGFDQGMMYGADSSQRCMKQDILVADLKSALLSRLAALRAENERLNRVLDEAAQHAKDAALDVLAATGIIGDLRAERDERAQWAVADRARIIREVVEKLPGIAAPEADFIAVEWFTEAGRFPYRVAMPRAALLDALLGTDGQEPA